MRTQPRVKMYIEIKPGQKAIEKRAVQQVRTFTFFVNGISVSTKLSIIASKTFEGWLLENKIKYVMKEAFLPAQKISVRGHPIKALGKHDLIISIHGRTLEDVMKEIHETEAELKRLGIKYERKCTWMCGI